MSETFIEVELENRTKYAINDYGLHFELITDDTSKISRHVTDVPESPIGANAVYKRRYMLADLLEEGQRMRFFDVSLKSVNASRNGAAPVDLVLYDCEEQ